MELTLSSALSSDSLLGHLAYVMLVISMLMRVMTWLRIFVIASALLAIAYGALILSDPVTVFWESLLIAVNIGQLMISHWRNLRARFTPVERAFLARHFPGLARGVARQVLDQGAWVTLPDGTVLAEEGAAVTHLTYLAEGRAEVLLGDARVSECREGDFIGEMTALTGAPATATVRCTGPTTVWRIEAGTLRGIVQRGGAVEREIDAAFARNYRAKIVQMNALVAAGRVPA